MPQLPRFRHVGVFKAWNDSTSRPWFGESFLREGHTVCLVEGWNTGVTGLRFPWKIALIFALNRVFGCFAAWCYLREVWKCRIFFLLFRSKKTGCISVYRICVFCPPNVSTVSAFRTLKTSTKGCESYVHNRAVKKVAEKKREKKTSRQWW